MTDSTIGAIIAAASGLLGAVLGSIVPFFLNKRTSKLEYELKKAELDKTASYRFGDAVACLQDDNLGVRMGGLYELQKLCLVSKEESERLANILTPFVKEHIENEKWLVPSILDNDDRKRIDQDVCLAGEIISAAYHKHKTWAILPSLKADKIYMRSFYLQGAYLWNARLEGTYFSRVHLEGAVLHNAHFEGARIRHAFLCEADLKGANLDNADLEWTDLRGAKNLTATQLLKAKNVEKAYITIPYEHLNYSCNSGKNLL